MKSHRFQFSLRTLLLAFVVFGLAMGQVVRPFYRGYRHRAVERQLTRLGAEIHTEDCDAGWMRNWLPEEASREIVFVRLRGRSPTDEDLAVLKECPRLRDLYLEGEHLSDEGFKCLGNLGGLQSLTVDHVSCRVSDKGISCLGHLECLEQLRLKGKAISDKTLAIICTMTNLRTLILLDSQITDQGLRQLNSLSMLEGVHLSGRQLTDEGLDIVCSLERLVFLGLTNTSMTDSGMRHLSRLGNLEELTLSRLRITDASVPQIQAIPRLKNLILDCDGLSKKGKAKLAKRLCVSW